MENLNWLGFELNAFLIAFIVLNVINVIIQTIKSLITINGTPMAAAVINAITFAIYTIVVVFMTSEGLGIIWKAIIIGIVNFIGVYVVKLFEAKSRKDKLWRVEATVPKTDFISLKEFIDLDLIPANYIDINKYVIVNFYCATQKESAVVRDLLNKYNAKYFVTESKTL